MSDPTVEPRPVRTAVSATTTMAVVVALVAVLLGFLILRDLNQNSSSSVDPGTGPVTTDSPDSLPVDVTTTTTPEQTSTTLLTTGFEVVVANASGVGGSAGKLTDQLTAKGFVTAPATNSASGTPIQSVTVVYYLPGFEAGAQSVATVLGGKATEAMPEAVPTESGSLDSASVLVLLGTDQAGKKLPKARSN
jgi:hypothetical protein